MNCVRETYPSVYSAIEAELYRLRRKADFSIDLNQDDSDVDGPFLKTIRHLVPSPQDQKAIEIIVRKTIIENSMPQGFSLAIHADYWQRLSSMPDIQSRDSDQPILRAIQEKEINDLAVALATRPEPFYSFINLMDASLLNKVSEHSISRWMELGIKDKNRFSDISVLKTLLNLHGKKEDMQYSKNEKELAFLNKIYNAVIPVSLLAAVCLEKLLTWMGLEENQHHRIRAEIVSMLTTTYTNKPVRLVEALVDAPPDTLNRLFHGDEHIRSRDSQLHPSNDWQAVSTTIVDAAKKNPKIMLPQIAALIAPPNSESGRPVCSEVLAFQLFRECTEFKKLLDSITQEATPASRCSS